MQSVNQRREAAATRQEQRAKLSDKQQLAKLDAMFGPGKGAKRERAKLQKRIDATTAVIKT